MQINWERKTKGFNELIYVKNKFYIFITTNSETILEKYSNQRETVKPDLTTILDDRIEKSDSIVVSNGQNDSLQTYFSLGFMFNNEKDQKKMISIIKNSFEFFTFSKEPFKYFFKKLFMYSFNNYTDFKLSDGENKHVVFCNVNWDDKKYIIDLLQKLNNIPDFYLEEIKKLIL